ncbi:MAG: hypothetical protein EOL88_01540 [Bacteroidia bacterium]|nr:hypothetical protein [Bacteroidia bacterium]
MSYGDEITLWPESFFTMLLSRMSVRGAKFFGTTNPDSPYHWLKESYLDRIGSGINNINRYSFTIDDNPNLDPEYVEALKHEYTGLFYKRFILGQWVLAEGAVYDMWDESIHVVDTNAVLRGLGKTNFDTYIVGVDYGTNNPCTFGLYGYNRGGGPVYLVREYYYNGREKGRQKTDREYADDFKMFLKGVRPAAIYIDPSASSFIAELKHNGFMISHANNDVLEGIRYVSTLLRSGKFYVDRSCMETIKEFGAYVWDDRAQEIGVDRPVKEFDHTMDRNRYALTSHFYRERPVVYKGFKY